ncbi:MAG: KilA-N domain-containing protein [Bacilli bacterium]|jgi:hypothetical protein|nr:KilA-N domain-containing protein [Bacilli bacterium]MCH4228992.1 KilA-N domain-containing protein [Bacilli bacterium]
MEQISVKGTLINITGVGDDDYISLTDIAKTKNPEFPADVIKNWMRLRGTIEFLGIWEQINNPSFNMVEFDQFKNDSGRNSFVLTPTKWVVSTNAIGIKTKSGKYGGGSYAHRDIALQFASWISAEVALYIIKEFQRLKIQEAEQLDWSGKRLLTKVNYLIHTESIKNNLIRIELTPEQKKFVFASEADLLNVALFGMTAKQWREANPNKKGNIRDYASTIELAILSNLEFQSAKLIEAKMSQSERLVSLNEEANREKDLFNRNSLKDISKLPKGK